MINGNLAYKYDNAVFNVALYEAQHGKIETIEHPEKVWLHEIRQRRTAEEQKPEKTAQAEKCKKLRYQKKLGIVSLIMCAACVLIGTQVQEMCAVAIPFLVGGIGLMRTNDVIV